MLPDRAHEEETGPERAASQAVAPETDAEIAAGYATLRASLYRYHATAFLAPAGTKRGLLLGAGRALVDVAEFPFARDLKRFVDRLDETPAKTLEENYDLLFITPPALISLYAGGYGDGGLGGRMEEILTAYRRIGLRATPSSGVRDDHLSVILEALAVIAMHEVEAIETEDGYVARACRDESRRLIGSLVLPILTTIRERLEIVHGGGPYHLLARSLYAFAVHDARVLQAVAEAAA